MDRSIDREIDRKGWVVFLENAVGVCGIIPKTLNLFMTEICAFYCPINDLTKHLVAYL